MNNAERKSGTANRPSVIFSSTYGGLPRFFWYVVIPFLLFGASVLFVRAVWFHEGALIRSVRVSPNVVAFAICPVLWALGGLLVAIDVYRHWHPQFILVTNWGVRLPKGPLTAETVSIAWDDLEAMVEARNLIGWHVYEFVCTDLSHDTSVRVNSMLFRDFDDFATFANLMNHHMGREWPIRGFWPGTVRGRRPTRD